MREGIDMTAKDAKGNTVLDVVWVTHWDVEGFRFLQNASPEGWEEGYKAPITEYASNTPYVPKAQLDSALAELEKLKAERDAEQPSALLYRSGTTTVAWICDPGVEWKPTVKALAEAGISATLLYPHPAPDTLRQASLGPIEADFNRRFNRRIDVGGKYICTGGKTRCEDCRCNLPVDWKKQDAIALLPKEQPEKAEWPVEEVSPGQFVHVDPESIDRAKQQYTEVPLKIEFLEIAPTGYAEELQMLLDEEEEHLEAVKRDAVREALIRERRRWWSPEYPGQEPPKLAVWWRDEPETGLSGFDTAQERDEFDAGGAGPFIRRITGNEHPQLDQDENPLVAALRILGEE